MKYTKLNEFKVAVAEATKEAEVIKEQYIKLETEKLEIEAKITAIDTEIESMLSGDKKMDAMYYLKLKSDREGLQAELYKKDSDLLQLRAISDIIVSDIINVPMEQYVLNRELEKEFRGNLLEIQKKLFKKLLEAEELINDIKALSDKYKNEVANVEHPKAQYHTFPVQTDLREILSRFNLRDEIRYNTYITSQKYKFEE